MGIPRDADDPETIALELVGSAQKARADMIAELSPDEARESAAARCPTCGRSFRVVSPPPGLDILPHPCADCSADPIRISWPTYTPEELQPLEDFLDDWKGD